MLLIDGLAATTTSLRPCFFLNSFFRINFWLILPPTLTSTWLHLRCDVGLEEGELTELSVHNSIMYHYNSVHPRMTCNVSSGTLNPTILIL